MREIGKISSTQFHMTPFTTDLIYYLRTTPPKPFVTRNSCKTNKNLILEKVAIPLVAEAVAVV
jgi:hypothetical protein